MAANGPSAPHLDHAISRFIEDFQNIIREHVERAVRKALGARRGRGRGKPVKAVSRSAPVKRAATRATKRPAKRGSAAQLSLF